MRETPEGVWVLPDTGATHLSSAHAMTSEVSTCSHVLLEPRRLGPSCFSLPVGGRWGDLLQASPPAPGIAYFLSAQVLSSTCPASRRALWSFKNLGQPGSPQAKGKDKHHQVSCHCLYFWLPV